MAYRIYVASDQLLVSHLYNLLEQAGLSVLTQKTPAEAPAEESIPLAWCSELWLMKDRELANAQQLLEQALAREPGFAPGAELLKFSRGDISRPLAKSA